MFTILKKVVHEKNLIKFYTTHFNIIFFKANGTPPYYITKTVDIRRIYEHDISINKNKFILFLNGFILKTVYLLVFIIIF